MKPTCPVCVLPRARHHAQSLLNAFYRLAHIESLAGLLLILAAGLAFILANSSYSPFYFQLINAPVSLSMGSLELTTELNFVVNDILMTVFFLAIGMEIRYEMHRGALASWRQASLPLAGALGGILLPASIFLAFNHTPETQSGWAVPTATDIAFALGVLALLGKRIPSELRIFLLALAVIDDIGAVLIIAVGYSTGFDTSGILLILLGIILVIGLQKVGIGSALGYLLPGSLIWLGLLKAGIHPTLAGIILGLMTPIHSVTLGKHALASAESALSHLKQSTTDNHSSVSELAIAQRELVPPATRIQRKLHPWVVFLIMPIFAFTNAGISLGEIDLSQASALSVSIGVFFALLLGKPIGILAACWIAIKLRFAQLNPELPMQGVALAAVFAGIGFTMSIFIANLAYSDALLLNAAKLAVLAASLSAALIGLAMAYRLTRNKPLPN